MTKLAFTGLAMTAMLALSPLSVTSASAGAQNLQCQGGFHKVRTYANSIKCKRVQSAIPTELTARRAANLWVKVASCNAHMSAPKKKVWNKSGKWNARVTFLCANIT